MATDFLARCDAIEECYEFMLAYAGQGLPGDRGSSSGSQLRAFLRRATDAMHGLGESCAVLVRQQNLQPVERYQAFLSVLERDAQNSLAACDLVLAQPSISSQLIDNLNASIHLRALLTDLFLLAEALKPTMPREDAVPAGEPEDFSA
ncbi:MAG: hypothetical protein JST79_14150 [Acidobacteria bacterium]|nr:hypothetical protein [Acidobacteriota bacterium]